MDLISKRKANIPDDIFKPITHKPKSFLKRQLGNFCFKRIMHAHFLFLDGMITEAERNDIIFYWKTIKAKWVLDQCHHLCKLCKYKHECWSNAKE